MSLENLKKRLWKGWTWRQRFVYLWASLTFPKQEMNWREIYKSLEQDYMNQLDRYNMLVKALGFEGGGWFDDVIASDEEILKRAEYLNSLSE